MQSETVRHFMRDGDPDPTPKQPPELGTGGVRTVSIPYAALLAGALAIGLSPILIRVSELTPLATAFHRVALAVPLLLVAALVTSGPAAAREPLSPRSVMWLIFAGALFAIDLACLHFALAHTAVANAMLLLNLAPFFVALFSWLFLGERVSRQVLAWLTLALVGLGLLLMGDAGMPSGHLFGDMLALAAGAAYGGYLTVIGRGAKVATATAMIISTAACSAFLLPVVLIKGETLLASTLVGWLVLLGLALVVHALGQGLIAYGLARTRATAATALLLLQPVISALAAWAVFDERLGPLRLAAAALVLFAVYRCQRLRPGRSSEPPA